MMFGLRARIGVWHGGRPRNRALSPRARRSASPPPRAPGTAPARYPSARRSPMQESTEDHPDGTVARVAAIDIAKASAVVCTRVPHEAREGRRVQQVWTVASTTNAILELGDRLVCQGVQRAGRGATRADGEPSCYLPEARGLESCMG